MTIVGRHAYVLCLSAGLAFAGLSCAPAESFTVDTGATGSFPGAAAAGEWPRWGGPGGDFQVEVAGLANTWPVEGPPTLWSRALGPGYSAVAARHGVLFTMYRDSDDEVIVALRADDGSTIWEHRYVAEAREANAVRFGKGPNATPLVMSDRVITLGYTGMLKCVSLDAGAVLWSHDLIGELGGEVLDFGNSASPMLYGDSVIVLVGGEHGAIAFDPEDGSPRWKSKSTTISYATPIVIDVEGQDQLVYFTADEIVGLDAASGSFLWSHPCVNEYRNNSTGPIWGDDGLLWVATQLDGGTRVLRLNREQETTRVEELWFNNKVSIHFWNSVRLGDHVYSSIGGQASNLAAVDVRTGEIKWRKRGFTQVNFVHAGEKTILLDENGHLALVTLNPEGMLIEAQARVLDDTTWTPPTLVGTTLYIRDKKSIRAVDLGVDSAAPTQPPTAEGA